MAAARAAATAPGPVPGPGIACVACTSGSTGPAKLICWSDAFLDVLSGWGGALGPGSTLGLVSPLCYAAGLSRLLVAWSRAATALVVTAPHLAAETLRELTDGSATALACMPPHVELLLASGLGPPPSLRRIFVTGAPIRDERLLELEAWLAGGDVEQWYGMAEVGRISRVLAADLRARPGCVGRPAPDGRLEIWDGAGQAVPPGTVGEIVLRLGAGTAHNAYWLADDELDARFRDGILRTGDLGLVDADGYLHLAERTGAILKVAGRSVSCVHIEETLRRPDEPPLLVVGVADRRLGQAPALLFEAGDLADRAQELRTRARRLLRSDEVPRWYLGCRALPRAGSGKVARGEAERWARSWTEQWPEHVACDGRLWPARRVGGRDDEPDRGVELVDGAPPTASAGLVPRPLPPAVRPITLWARGAERPSGWAGLWVGRGASLGSVRLAFGPCVTGPALGAHLGEITACLLELLTRLPGVEPAALGVLAADDATARAYDALGLRRLSPAERIFARGIAAASDWPRVAAAAELRAVAAELGAVAPLPQL